MLLLQKEIFVKSTNSKDYVDRDYGYVAYLRKAADYTIENECRDQKERRNLNAKYHEGLRDYFSASLRQINHLIQIDKNPNIELMEPKWELYKISVSFKPIGKLIVRTS